MWRISPIALTALFGEVNTFEHKQVIKIAIVEIFSTIKGLSDLFGTILTQCILQASKSLPKFIVAQSLMRNRVSSYCGGNRDKTGKSIFMYFPVKHKIDLYKLFRYLYILN